MDMHLQAGTPALLPRLLKEGARQRQLAEAEFPGAPLDWTAPYLFDVLGSRSPKTALTIRGKKALLAYMSGRYATRSVLAGWGFAVDVKCPHCGRDDTAYHRIFECDLAFKPDHMLKRLKQWQEHPGASRGILHIKAPTPPPADLTPRYQLFGRDVTPEVFGAFLPADGPVYIDGSVIHGKSPFASGGWAVLQLAGDRVSRSIMGPVDPDFPATSDFAEHIACHYAAAHVRAGSPVELVTDCASVISYYQAKLRQTATAYDRVLGGLWVDIDASRFSAVHKVKSHLHYEAAVARGMGAWWKGNSLVDDLAQQAARLFAVPEAEARAYLRAQRRAASYLRDLTASLLKWQGEEVHMHDLPKVPQQATGKRVRPRHQYEWLPDLQLWACGNGGSLHPRASTHRGARPSLGTRRVSCMHRIGLSLPRVRGALGR
jgi:hypothetical protein